VRAWRPGDLGEQVVPHGAVVAEPDEEEAKNPGSVDSGVLVNIT
jgi:hypothetical protein